MAASRQRFTDGEPHGRNLLSLRHNDFLCQPFDLFVMTVAQHGDRHGDRALMMRNHHCREIPVDIARRLDLHIDHHFLHGIDVCRNEWRFRSR